jgi:hypothetical protein
MAALSDGDLLKALKAAGFSGEAIFIMGSIVKAESGGDPRAHYVGPRDDSYGLAQINMLGALGPDRIRRYNLRSASDLFDPATNLRVAYAMSNQGTKWSDWATYNDGSYKQHSEGLVAAESGLGDGWSPSDLPGQAWNVITFPWQVGKNAAEKAGEWALEQLGNALGAAVEPFVKGLKRLMIIGTMTGLGVALVGMGMWRSVKAPE